MEENQMTSKHDLRILAIKIFHIVEIKKKRSEGAFESFNINIKSGM